MGGERGRVGKVERIYRKGKHDRTKGGVDVQERYGGMSARDMQEIMLQL